MLSALFQCKRCSEKKRLVAHNNNTSGMKESTGALVVFLIASTMYGTTLHPSVAGGDSGELMVTAEEWAIPHPPGYPTFALTTKLASIGIKKLFAVDVGMAQNMYHASLSTFAVVFLFLACHRVGASVGASIGASLLFGFCPNVWTYAVSTEVFPLNNFFMCLLVFMAVTFEMKLRHYHNVNTKKSKEDLRRFVHLSSFVGGLSLTNQHTSILFVIPIVLWVFCKYPRTVTHLPTFLKSTIMFFLGFSPYLYMPISATFVYSPNAWGRQNTWSGFWKHLLREEYGTFSLASKEASYKQSNFIRCWKAFVLDISDQTLYCLWVLALIAALAVVNRAVKHTWEHMKAKAAARRTSSKKNQQAAANKGGDDDDDALDEEEALKDPALAKRITRPKKAAAINEAGSNPLSSPQFLLVITWLLYTNFFNYLSNLPIEQPLFYGVQQRFWLQPLIISAMFVALGITYTIDYFVSKTEDDEDQDSDERNTFSKHNLMIVLGLIIGFAQISANYHTQNESDNYYVRDFGRAILGPLPKGSLVLTKGDIMVNSARFMQVVEGFRPDLLIVDQEMMTFPWYVENLRRAYTEKEVKFPGQYYFPQRPGCFDMKTFLDKNRRGGKRRVFLAYGFKEGDTSIEGYYTTRQFGMTLEVITQEDANEINEKVKLKIPDSTIGWPKKGKLVDQYTRELFFAMPDIPPHRVAPVGRYPAHSWEAVITADFQQGLQIHAHQLLVMAEADQTQADVQLPHPYKYYAQNITRTLWDESVPVRYRALLAARKYSVAALSHFDLLRTQPFIRRNLGVILQNINRFHSQTYDKTLITELRDTFHTHMQEARAHGALTPQDAKNIQGVLDHYHQLIQQHGSADDGEDDDEDVEMEDVEIE